MHGKITHNSLASAGCKNYSLYSFVQLSRQTAVRVIHVGEEEEKERAEARRLEREAGPSCHCAVVQLAGSLHCVCFAERTCDSAKYAKMAVALSCLTVRTRQRAGEEGNYGFSLKKEKKAENYPR